jgi:hypothetical protein
LGFRVFLYWLKCHSWKGLVTTFYVP